MLTEALAETHPDDASIAMHFCEAHRQLALAEAGAGDRDSAERILDALFERYSPLGNPLLLGLLHKARAEIAARAKEQARFDAELARMHDCFRATENPALIAQWEQLRERSSSARDQHTAGPSLAPISKAELVAVVRSSPTQHANALRLTLTRARASRGYLYLWRAGKLSRVEAVGGDELPVEVEAALLRDLVSLLQDDAPDNDDGATIATFSDAPSAAAEHGFQHVVLSVQRSGGRAVVGGVILEMAASDLYRLDLEFRAALADALCEQASEG